MKKLFSFFLEALRGDENNFTTGSINKAIFMLAVPSILEMSLESVFAIVDVAFVSQVGTDAVAVVGLTESVLTIFYSVAWGFSVAATAIISRRIGENNEKGASEAAGQVILISIVLSLLMGVPSFFFAEDILMAMGASQAVITNGLPFTRLMFASTPAIILLYTLSGVLRGAGNASYAMRSLVVANTVNILLDSVLVLGFLFFPKLGVLGAAVATTTGRTLGVLYQFRKLSDGTLPIKIAWKDLRPSPELIKKFLEIASGSTIQFIIASASWVFLTRILSSFGSEVVAGYTIAIRIIIFTILPSWGMANAAATLVGQNLGANQPERAEKSAWRAAYFNTIFLAIVAVVFFAFAPSLIALFTNQAKSIETGVQCLRVICLGYVFFANGMVLVQAFNGAGDTRTPTLMNLVCFWAIEIPLAYLLAQYWGFGPMGVFVSVAISESLMAIFAIILFRRGKWKLVKV